MSRPQTRELECFVAVAEFGNFTQAARSLHMTQPPLTRQIQSLENRLGVRLFDRDTHSVALTSAGGLLLEDARAILARLDHATESMRRTTRGEVTRLRLAFVGALLDEKLISTLRKFRRLHPACQVQITDLAPGAQLEALRGGELDGGFTGARLERCPRGLEQLTWKNDPLVLALPEDHPLAGAKKLVWPDLRDAAWLLVSRTAGPAFRRQFSELCRRHHLPGRVVQESERVAAILTMVAAGSGISLVPDSVRHLVSAGVVFRPTPRPHPVLRQVFTYAAQDPSEELSAFRELLRKQP